ncbi:MAG: hypothetical protein IPI38_01430 [Gemmatimonadetes bacterium]|nr:hypothetical protein [Gemmatimonadota bacterium]MBK7348518.1 hypothetical protein [Gemmatimonadota bacterium]MBK7714086.1 hypothetical protein [Gemmatimonadota bacterium]MBK7783146.1 hypothetical protein [Gemmatimonadota bacterium]MBK7924089.1 hypothetical protein [Gemmatimonadota bacterium]
MTHPLVRWLGALLAASAVCYATWLLTGLVFAFVLPAAGRLLAPGLPDATAGAMFVYVASKVAPPHRRVPFIALLGFALLLSGLTLAGVLAFPAGQQWIGVAAALLGAGGTAWLVAHRPPYRLNPGP